MSITRVEDIEAARERMVLNALSCKGSPERVRAWLKREPLTDETVPK